MTDYHLHDLNLELSRLEDTTWTADRAPTAVFPHPDHDGRWMAECRVCVDLIPSEINYDPAAANDAAILHLRRHHPGHLLTALAMGAIRRARHAATAEVPLPALPCQHCTHDIGEHTGIGCCASGGDKTCPCYQTQESILYDLIRGN